MRTLNNRRSILFCAAFLAACAPAMADSGLTGAPILNRPVGARSSGMGRAFTAVPGDVESLMYNPAGLASVPSLRAYAAYMNGFGGGSYGFAAVPVRVGGFVLAPAYLYYNSGSMNLNLTDGTVGSVTAELDKVAMLSAAYTPLAGLAVGATAKRTTIDLAETASAAALHYDFGTIYTMKNGLSFGAASLNNGGAIKFEDKGDPAPAALRAGASYKLVFTPANLLDSASAVTYCDMVFAADWSKIAKEKGYYQSGLEMNMQMPQSIMFSLRGGYLFDRAEEGLTFGFSIKSGRWDFAFAYETAKKLNSRNPVSVSYQF